MSPQSCAATTATSQVTASTQQRFLALSNSDRRLCYVLNITYTKQKSTIFLYFFDILCIFFAINFFFVILNIIAKFAFKVFGLKQNIY